jgi:hypothetical protein
LDSPAPNILFCLPAFKGAVAAQTTATLFDVVNLLRDIDASCSIMIREGSDIVVTRNLFASDFIANRDWTHLFFIDDDMVFEPELIINMLRADKPIMGAVAPKRQIDFDRFYACVAKGDSLERAKAESVEFVVRHKSGERLVVEEGLCKVEAVGMATTLIKREVFDTMLSKIALRSRMANDGANGARKVYGFFDQIHIEADGQYLSEDLSFCYRWTHQCNGETWMVADQEIGHVGAFTFAANYMEILKQGRTA